MSSSTFTPRSLHSQDFATPSSLQNFPLSHHSHIHIANTHGNNSRIQPLVGKSEISPRVIPARFVPFADTLYAAEGGGGGDGREGSKLPISGRFTCILICICMHTHTQAQAHTHVHTHTVCVCVCVILCIHIHSFIHTYIYAQMYKYTHTMI